MSNEYFGKKYFCSGERITKDIYGNEVIKPEFKMTRGYLDYLKQKKELERKTEINTLKLKLEYEYKTYGIVDHIELDYYLKIIKDGI